MHPHLRTSLIFAALALAACRPRELEFGARGAQVSPSHSRAPAADASVSDTGPSRDASPRTVTDAGSLPACDVRVIALRKAEAFAGPGPMTPALNAQLTNDPRFAEFHNGISHGDEHLQCTFEVSVNRVRYRYIKVVGNLGHEHETSYCATRGPDAVAEIVGATQHCRDLHAGEYYGYRLVPVR